MEPIKVKDTLIESRSSPYGMQDSQLSSYLKTTVDDGRLRSGFFRLQIECSSIELRAQFNYIDR